MHFKYFLSQTNNELGVAYDAQELFNPDCVTALALFMKSWKRSYLSQNYFRNENSMFNPPQRRLVPQRPGPTWTFFRGILRGLTVEETFSALCIKG